MRTTVERGKARCPRCGRAADYAFTAGDSDTLWYEVDCGDCGHTHAELAGTLTAA